MFPGFGGIVGVVTVVGVASGLLGPEPGCTKTRIVIITPMIVAIEAIPPVYITHLGVLSESEDIAFRFHLQARYIHTRPVREWEPSLESPPFMHERTQRYNRHN